MSMLSNRKDKMSYFCLLTHPELAREGQSHRKASARAQSNGGLG